MILEPLNGSPLAVGVLGSRVKGKRGRSRREAVEVGSLWVAEQPTRPIAKAWNASSAASIAATPKPAGSPEQIAILVRRRQ